MEPLNAPATEDAQRFGRPLGKASCLQAGIMSPTAGSRVVKLCSLREVEAFLKPLPVAGDMHTKINYVEPAMLTTWVHDVIGDAELADRIGETVASQQPYGLLALEIKQTLAERLVQYDEALAEAQ